MTSILDDGLTGDDVRALIAGLTDEEIAELVDQLPPAHVPAALELLAPYVADNHAPDPITLAATLYDDFRARPHLAHLSEVITTAVRRVEEGHSERIIVELPPRTGKTTMSTLATPAWIMQQHPDWPIALTSHDGRLANSWGRQIRRWAEAGTLGTGVAIAPDAGAVGSWETTARGRLLSMSIRESFTGRGAKVLIIDDPHKDFADAHSKNAREAVWDWWKSVAQTRLEPPSLVIIVMTRWHEDDLVGRILSTDYEGDPADWTVVRLPAIADGGTDALDRAEGDPLISPLLDETPDEAVDRWAEVRVNVGEYVWSAMFQQTPAPAKGAIFNMDRFRFWTTDPDKATDDDSVILLNPAEDLTGARWLDSWDLSFEGADDSDYAVGQRWARKDANRYLIAQQRGKWSFTQQIDRLEAWARPSSPYGHLVHERLIEKAANGAAALSTLKDRISGLKPVKPVSSKEVRARTCTPEVESGNVILPHPADPGNEWVNDLLSELRNFPHDVHDDQVDSLTQALIELRAQGRSHIGNPGTRQRAPEAGPRRTRGVGLAGRSRPRGPGGR